MPVWIGTIFYSLFIAVLGGVIFKNKKYTASDSIGFSSETNTKSINLFFALATFALLVFFVGNRSYIFDTSDYQTNYDLFYTDDLNQIYDIIDGSNKVKGPAFSILLILFKHFTHGTFNDWFLFVATIQMCSIAVFFYKFSSNYLFSVFLFYFSSCFLWLVNGMRQFLAVAIILFFVDWIKKHKTIPFLLIVLLAYYFHSSAILWIPVYFLVNMKPWSKKFIILSIVLSISIFFVSRSSLLNDTEYSYITMTKATGVNIFRVLVMSIPTIIAFVKRREIENKASPVVNLFINVSVICAECYIVGLFTSGLVARLAVYFQIFTYILLPWLLKNAFDEDTGKSITIVCIIGFVAYFYYDMIITGNGIYNSTILDLHFVD